MTEEILSTILIDDDTPYGGTSHSNETLEEFLNEAGYYKPFNLSITEINTMLVESGIRPLKEFLVIPHKTKQFSEIPRNLIVGYVRFDQTDTLELSGFIKSFKNNERNIGAVVLHTLDTQKIENLGVRVLIKNGVIEDYYYY